MSESLSQEQSSGLVSLPAIVDMAKTYHLSPQAFAYTFRMVAMPRPHTEAEFVSCCLVAREHGLNPLTKEIYFMRTKAGQIQPIVSVDGWIKKGNEHPQFDGMELTPTLDDKGKPVSMTISVYRKDRSRPTTLTEYFDECSQAGGPVWKTSPHRMLRNRAITQGMRVAFGFAGIMAPDEFDQWQATDRRSAVTITATPAPPSVPMDDAGVPTMDEPAEVEDVPAIPGDSDEPFALEQEVRFLDDLKSELAACPIDERESLIEARMELFCRLSDAGQRKAEAIIEGRS